MNHSPRPRRSFHGYWLLAILAACGAIARRAHATPGEGSVPLAQVSNGPASSPPAALPPQAQTQTPAMPPQSGPTTAPAPPPSPSLAPVPANKPPPATDAASALDRARAAYEYGDIDEMVDSARQVSEGRLHPTSAQRAYALRLLGIGLFLTGRPEGAETAFFELLRLRPESRLDPQTTRPDAVAFFERVRLRYAEPIRDAARASNRKTFLWNFFPPAGQFQNGHRGRGFTIGGIELVSLATAVTTYSLLKSWEGPDLTFPGHKHQAEGLRTVNWISVAVLGAAYVYGVIDGIAHYADQSDDSGAGTTARLSISPTGMSLDF